MARVLGAAFALAFATFVGPRALLASHLEHSPARNRPTTQLTRQYPYYHTSEELRSEIQRLAAGCGGAMSTQTVRDGNDGKPEVAIDVVHVKVPGTSPKNRVFLLFGEHSRELISPESGLYFLKSLCGETALSSSGNVNDVLRDSEFMIVMNANPLSRLKVEDGEFCWRGNLDGVDLNRNFDDHFVGGGAMDGGTKPFSEPETRIVKGLVTGYQPTAFVSVHSGTRGMYMPYAYGPDQLAARNGPAMFQILQKLDEKHCKCPYGAAGKEIGYNCPGTSVDWAYDKLNTPFSFALEIYTSHDKDAGLRSIWNEKVHTGGSVLLERGENLAHAHFADLFRKHSSDFIQRRAGEGDKFYDGALRGRRTPEACFLQYNPTTKEDYDSTVENWAAVYLEMSQMIASQL